MVKTMERGGIRYMPPNLTAGKSWSIASTAMEDSGAQSCAGDSFGKPSGIRYVLSNPTVGKHRYITSTAEDDSGAQT